jgi:hypothetical protein
MDYGGDNNFFNAPSYCPNNACVRYCTISGPDPVTGYPHTTRVMRWIIFGGLTFFLYCANQTVVLSNLKVKFHSLLLCIPSHLFFVLLSKQKEKKENQKKRNEKGLEQPLGQ